MQKTKSRNKKTMHSISVTIGKYCFCFLVFGLWTSAFIGSIFVLPILESESDGERLSGEEIVRLFRCLSHTKHLMLMPCKGLACLGAESFVGLRSLTSLTLYSDFNSGCNSNYPHLNVQDLVLIIGNQLPLKQLTLNGFRCTQRIYKRFVV